MRIENFNSRYEPAWVDLFASYFLELGDDLPEQIIRSKVCGFILEAIRKGTVCMCLILDGDRPIGFGIYQIDSPESDWCKREGWGFIREFYVEPAFRGRGWGRIRRSTSRHGLWNSARGRFTLRQIMRSLSGRGWATAPRAGQMRTE